MEILDASLDTSFWNAATPLGLVPYLFDYFRVHYCTAVRREIITTEPHVTSLIYPQAKLFEVFETDGRLHRQEPQRPLTRFGVGEAHAIAMALEQNWVLLLNDNRPCFFARALGIHVVTAPNFCVFLYSQGKLTFDAVQGCLKRMTATTSHLLIVQAQQTLDLLVGSSGAPT